MERLCLLLKALALALPMSDAVDPTWFATQERRSPLEFLAFEADRSISMLQVLTVGNEAPTDWGKRDKITTASWEAVMSVFPSSVGQRASLDELWFIFQDTPRTVADALAPVLIDGHDCSVRAVSGVFPAGARRRLALLDSVGAALVRGEAHSGASGMWRIERGVVSPMQERPRA